MTFYLPSLDHIEISRLLRQGKQPVELEILYSEAEARVAEGIIIYRGGVKAKLGPTTLTTDTLIVRRGKHGDPDATVEDDGKSYTMKPLEAIATGKVDIVDPDGTIHAKNIWFTWDQERRSTDEVVAKAEDADIHMATVDIKAASMTQSRKLLHFTKAKLSSGYDNPPLFQFDADDVDVTPGSRANAHGVQFRILGLRFPKLPLVVISLDPRSNGIQLPRIGYRQGAGLGTSWGGDYLLDEKSAVLGNINIYPEVRPVYRFAYAQSRVPFDEAGINQFAMSDSFGDRSDFSFFGNVYNRTQEGTYDRIRVKKDLYTISTTFNYETFGRVTDRTLNYQKPLELAYEKGGPAGNWGYLVQGRASRIIDMSHVSANRVTFKGSLMAPLVQRGRLTMSGRLDGSVWADSNTAGYVGIEGGLSYEILHGLNLSAGAYGYHNFGVQTFLGDNFITNQGYVVRGDWLGPSNSMSFLYRYDPAKGWFDRQFRLSQVVGSIEPVFVYRQAPRQYLLGIRFRFQDIARLLQKKQIERFSGPDLTGGN